MLRRFQLNSRTFLFWDVGSAALKSRVWLADCRGRSLLRAASLGKPSKVDRVVLECACSSEREVHTLASEASCASETARRSFDRAALTGLLQTASFSPPSPDRQHALIRLSVFSETGWPGLGANESRIFFYQTVNAKDRNQAFPELGEGAASFTLSRLRVAWFVLYLHNNTFPCIFDRTGLARLYIMKWPDVCVGDILLWVPKSSQAH